MIPDLSPLEAGDWIEDRLGEQHRVTEEEWDRYFEIVRAFNRWRREVDYIRENLELETGRERAR